MSTPEELVQLQLDGRIARIIFNNPQKLNAMSGPMYQRLANLLREIADMDDVVITILMGSGRFFSAGADVKAIRKFDESIGESPRFQYTRSFGTQNLELTRAFYHHPKLLIAALNGPVVGLTAALLGHCDFIYALPNIFLLTPFTSLGLVAEGGSSYMFCKRMGLPLAQEALIGSKKITADRLLSVNFINKIFPASSVDEFNAAVVRHVNEEFGPHLNAESMLLVKKLIRDAFLDGLEKANVLEVTGGVERFIKGIPQAEFAKIVRKEKKHKL